ncbi:MAG TPA: acyl-CoA carboxylase subunit beta, partial [Terriglobales bacterium]|nr:acyl-CoA carboxylase subunit beta [Terriglobales bacterium]
MRQRTDSTALSINNVLPTKADPSSLRFESNMRALADLVAQVRNEEERIREGGGAKAIESQHAKSRLTARERIDLLADPGSFFELGLYAAHKMYEEWGGAPAAGVITGLARIQTRMVMLIVNDATVKAGAFFPMTTKKVIRAQNIAIENRIPTIYLVDSAGVFLPLQEDVFPDTDDFGRVFRNNAVMSAMGIPQIAAIMGMCVAGGGYLPVMCDHVLMTDGSGLFLAGPALVQAAIGQKISAEELGGAAMHSAISGTLDFREPNDEACLARIRSLIDKWGYRRQSLWDRKQPVDPTMPAEEIYGAYDASPARPYDMKEILARIVDESRFDEYKPEYGKTLICGYARIGGFAVGIVANQKLHAHQTDHEGHKRIEFGGVIYTESAEKAARFIMDCNQSLIPLVFFHDVNGFMVGRDAEWTGIIKAGAKMVNAVSNSVVPKITVIVGGSFGAGHYAMCGKAYDPRFVFAWPTAKYAVMSGDAAAGTLVEIKVKQLERSGK